MLKILTTIGLFSACICTSLKASAIDLEDSLIDTTVITPTRLKQALKDSPSSVTIITEDMLSRHGITSVLEALRLVPGFHIDYIHDHDIYAIANYHGTNAISARRLNIQINGFSLYRPMLARTFWDSIPVDVAQIKRIEVIRGPASASYGPNSFMGVINIITKEAIEMDSSVSASGNNRGGQRLFGTYNTALEHTTLMLNAKTEEVEGPDRLKNTGEDYRSGQQYSWVSLATSSQFDRHDIDFSWTSSRLDRKVDTIESGEISNPDWDNKDNYFTLSWQQHFTNHTLALRGMHTRSEVLQEWQSCQPTALLLRESYDLYQVNPRLAGAVLLNDQQPATGSQQEADALAALNARLAELGADASSLSCGNVNNNYREISSTVELVDTYSSDTLRVSSVLSFRRDGVESQTYLNGKVNKETYSASVNAAWLPADTVTINAGLNYEYNNKTKGLLSPRLAFNYHVSPHHTVRLSSTKGYRTPDIWEEDINWSYNLVSTNPNITGERASLYFVNARSSNPLESEKIISHELAYMGMFPEQGLRLNAKVFNDKLYSLLSEKLEISSFEPTNNGRVDLSGVEIEAYLESRHGLLLNAGIAYLDNDTDDIIEKTQYSRLSGFIALSQKINDQWTVGAAYYGGANSDNTTHFDRYDMTFLYRPTSSLNISAQIKYQPNPVHESVLLPNFTSNFTESNVALEDDNALWVGLAVSVGL